MSYDPTDAWHEAAAEALQEGIIDDYRDSDSFEEDIGKGIARFTAGRQRSHELLLLPGSHDYLQSE